MKLTEAKLKQMIVEAIKNKRFQDFGTPTPDEKLKAQLGDEMFDKIQALGDYDMNQADIMKQSFDPNYPMRIETDSFADILKSYGFKYAGITSGAKKDSVSQVWERGEGPYDRFVLHILIDPTWSVPRPHYPKGGSRKIPFFLRYHINLDRNYQYFIKKKEYIPIPKMFDIDLTDEEDLRDMETLVLKREKENIIKALEQLA